MDVMSQLLSGGTKENRETCQQSYAAREYVGSPLIMQDYSVLPLHLISLAEVFLLLM
jgi:hypothetical protein